MEENALDNPAWEALNSLHAGFAQGTVNAKRYRAGILPFTGCNAGGNGSMEELDSFIKGGESFFIIGDLPALPAGWIVELELPCAQMLKKDATAVPSPAADEDIVIKQLEEADAAAMFDLISLVQPGYYHPDTRLLGTYFGIKDKGRLVAMAGERMRLPGFSELSAIGTLSGYTGRGYAQKLIAKLCNLHASAGIVSFLHVALGNQRAIRLYQHMGFEQRRTIVFRKVKKTMK